MTNLQDNSTRLSPRNLRRLWFGLPAAAIVLLAMLLGFAVLAPLWSALQADSKRLRELQDLQDQVVLMRQQMASQDMLEERALAQKDKLVDLIIGSGDVSTFLAMLDREAKATGVQLDLYQPQAPTPPAKEAQPDPMEAEGLQRTGMQILAKAPYPKLLNLLERIEALNVLVEQSGLKLELRDPASSDPKLAAIVPPVTMTIGFSLYGRSAASRSESAQAAAAGGASGGPAAAGAPPPAKPTSR